MNFVCKCASCKFRSLLLTKIQIQGECARNVARWLFCNLFTFFPFVNTWFWLSVSEYYQMCHIMLCEDAGFHFWLLDFFV